MNIKPKIYLSGAIQRAEDPWTWRFAMRNSLQQHYDIIIPEDKIEFPPKATFEDRQIIIKHNIILKDIHDVLDCNEFFVKLDPYVFKSAGTVAEITFAAYFRKPITYILDDIAMDDMPGWIHGCLSDADCMPDIKAAIQHFRDKITK